MKTRLASAIGAVLAVVAALFVPSGVAVADACANGNAIACENSKPGSPASEWDISGAGDADIQGFATDISVNAGQSVDFKIDTSASAYTITIYRLGWYGGDGARKIATVTPSVTLPQAQPACLTDATTNLVDCGNWAVSASWAVPSTAVSGVYIAKLYRPDNGDDSQITFIVRDDTSHADVVYQTADLTWQAYNKYGGSNFYNSPNKLSGSQARAFKLSYNRPFTTRGDNAGRDFLFSNEYPMIRFLERNGYDVSYISGVDTARYGSLLLNHKVFVSVGHDEYWSGQQRRNVEAARDAGVSLAFFSGNEVYWKTRWEPSIDGTNTSYRTLVCYKETWDNAKTDPSSEWTGTWRDPRSTPPSDGGRPENGLTGTAYMSNFTDLAIQVSATQGKLRVWRNTAAATLAPGTSLSLAPHSIGYESDEDLDNRARPAGLIDLSTTTGSTPQYLRDFGNTVTAGTTTHHLTLYRAPSGALVFGAGTIQWAWGLDDQHDGTVSPPDPTMQQATINVLADMGVQPTTLMSGRVASAASPDSTAPTTAITSPASGASEPNGTTVTVAGTASDVGGVVAGVEVSTDGGTSWHEASGTTSWTYSYVQHGNAQATIQARATDDSLNTGAAASVTVATSCPCDFFGSVPPQTVDAGDTSAVELGVRFTPSVNGWVSGVRFYKSTGNTGTHTGSLWAADGSRLATGTFTGESASGWQTLQFAAPVAVTAGTPYVASYYAPAGHYSADQWFYSTADVVAPPLTAPRSASAAPNGVFTYGPGFPNRTYADTSYGVDVLFNDKDVYPPTVSSTTPLSGASSVSVTVAPGVVMSEAVDPASVKLTLTDPVGASVPGTTAYDSTSRTITFTPEQPLTRGTTYTAAVQATDLVGNAMPAPSTWSFTTAQPDPTPWVCPCSVWTDATTPANVSVDEGSKLELGVRFTAATDGVVTGVRFYKGPRNTGTHTGSLWSASGTLLATATFGSESSTGWQTVTFASPVSVTAGTTYVASYQTSVGYYSADWSAFASKGVDSGPLHVLVGGGAYQYGGGFPAGQSNANYWVDPVFTVPSSLPPAVASMGPADGSTSVPVSSTVTATFAGAIQPGTASVSLVGPAGAVAGATSYDTATRTATFVPGSALTAGATYTATVSGALNLGGTAMTAPAQGTFTTSSPSSCPCTLFPSRSAPAVADSSDTAAVTLGVRFKASVTGYVTAVRFYKSAANTGTHTVSLWSGSGTRLATVQVSGESASGWQTATFPQAVQLTAGTTYVAAYYAPNGHYAADPGFFSTAWVNDPLTAPVDSVGNGVYAYGSNAFPDSSYNATNYWVDPVFATGTAPDTSAPTVTATSPIDKASSVSATVLPSATFSESVTSSTVTFTLTDAGGTAVPGSVAYDATTQTATFTPAQALARGVTYTAAVSASDEAGNVMAAPVTWSFTTAQPSPAPGVCPCGFWDDATTPATVTVDESANLSLGLRFTADTAGQVTGVRFYKGPKNTGTHTGSLWASDGTQLATATFTGESSTGWQAVTFSSPVTVTAGTTYVVSYSTTTGYYSATTGFFTSQGLDVPPLHATSGSAVYHYGGGFPSSSSNTNYWVDLVFSPSTSGG